MRFGLGGLKARFVLVFVIAVAVVAGSTAVALAIAARSWVYTNAQDVAIAEFRDDMAPLYGAQVDTTDPAELEQFVPGDVTAVVDGQVVRRGSVDPSQISESFAAGLDSVRLVRFQRLDSQRILLGMSFEVTNTAYPGAGPERELVKAYAIRPLVGVQEKFDSLIRIVAVTLTAGVVICGLLGWWIASTLVRPLRRLDDAAAQAAAGDLDVRLPEVGVTELARVTETFNEMMRQHGSAITRLTASESQSRRFVADVSHELRTPLAALVPVGEILREEADRLPADTGAAARIVGEEIDKLARLVEDLIEMSRHDVGRARLDLAEVDLAELVRGTLTARGWEDRVPVSATAPVPVQGDARRLEVVVANLVGNALRHGADPVEVSVRREADEAVVEVRDHGAGVPEQHRAEIFERFFKVDTARGRSEGSGLGLSLALENARLHRGTIDVRRVADATVFTLRVPVGSPAGDPSDG
ncbi:sensor histidine kinase [Rhodococcus tukisamuensis]|uniref:histidine kinase n=1 Tax=Rhodococcus tukisamuensis TaxID=168276 RepID=A0A1G7B4R6_9NOCA|nr:HAMP domain-containing sensor histidine kinase [Rhodococcus tukisamuensis]SDE22021.1 two-component system, OmpR family, sensor histidine kinase MtrB [Rhodococcus tukisamuensis]